MWPSVWALSRPLIRPLAMPWALRATESLLTHIVDAVGDFHGAGWLFTGLVSASLISLGKWDGRLIKPSLYTYVTNSIRRRNIIDIVGPKGTASAASTRVYFFAHLYSWWGCKEAITYFNMAWHGRNNECDIVFNNVIVFDIVSHEGTGTHGTRFFLAINRRPRFGPHYHPFDIELQMACQSMWRYFFVDISCCKGANLLALNQVDVTSSSSSSSGKRPF